MDNASGERNLQLILTWLLVGIPLVWGVYKTLLNAWQLFQ